MGRVRILLILTVCASFMFAQFEQATEVITNFDTAAKSTVGVIANWVFGMLPLILFCVGIFATIKYSKKQAEQDQDSTKMYLTAAGVGILGALVGILIDALIGAALMGDSAKGIEVLTNFWKGLLGV